MAASVPVVRAHFILFLSLSSFIFAALLLIEGEDDDLNVLLGCSLTDKLDGKLFIRPVGTGEAVKDCTSVAVIFLQTLGKHSKKQLLRQVLELLGVKFLNLVFLVLLLLLLLLILSNLILELNFLILEVLGGLVSHGVATFLPEVIDLVKADQAALMLLGKEVSSCGSTRANWAK